MVLRPCLCQKITQNMDVHNPLFVFGNWFVSVFLELAQLGRQKLWKCFDS